MTTIKKLLPLFFLTMIVGLASCESEEDTSISGNWNVTTWSENGVADSDVPSVNMVIAFSGNTMTISGANVEFNYTGNYSLNANNNLTATLDETTGDSEINVFTFDVATTTTSTDLTLDGSLLKLSPFWPDTTVTVAITATR
ncbi:MAG: hypothetical protein ACI85F_001379 [Bacteroidia bacterium]|jgi:hypothetical protein